jgi:hypothetical protein
VCLNKFSFMNAYEGVEVRFHTYLTPALDEGSCPSNLLSQNGLVLRNMSLEF